MRVHSGLGAAPEYPGKHSAPICTLPPHLGFPEDGGHTFSFGFFRGFISQQSLADQLLLPPRLPQSWGRGSRLSVGWAQRTQNPAHRVYSDTSHRHTTSSCSLACPPAPASRSRLRRRSSSTPQPADRRRPCRLLHMVELEEMRRPHSGRRGSAEKVRTAQAQRGAGGGRAEMGRGGAGYRLEAGWDQSCDPR